MSSDDPSALTRPVESTQVGPCKSRSDDQHLSPPSTSAGDGIDSSSTKSSPSIKDRNDSTTVDNIYNNNNNNDDDEAPAYEVTGLPLALVILGLALAIFLMSLDSSIIATAIPRITSQFHSTGDIAWYGSAYSFAMCALQPMAGTVFSQFSMKWSFFACIGVFELGSLLCALSVNSPMLIVGRAIAGAGAAGCFTGAFCIVAICIPLSKRAAYVGVLQSTFGIATIIGPILGGALTQHASWRWCFWINLPLGAVTIVTLFFCFHPPKGNAQPIPVLDKLKKFDFVGLFLFAPSVIMLLLAVQWGGTTRPWNSATIIGLFVGGGLLSIVFMVWQVRQGDAAMIPPRLLKERSMLFSCTAEFFAMGAIYISIYYLPEWFQVVRDASSTQSGVMYLPLALSDVFAAIATGLSLKYVGYPNVYILLGTGLMAIGCGLLTTLHPDTSHTHWIPFQVLQGLGAGMTVSMPYVATQIVLKPADIPVGTATLQCFQFFGASVLLAVGECLFQNRLVSQLSTFNFDMTEIEKILSAGSAAVRSVVTADELTDVLLAYNNAITHTFYLAASVAAVALFLSLGIRWKSVKPPKQWPDSAADASEKA
ncbi:hypothetical protein Sste5346_008692 [Sporothrix stenoceras]|uniref:Major facilitator superfamily (MFS) profile domain-containing protein n=1 Tax=Sporothrix stenoceras TaxID=5173 RepID=A0ABR3YP42_9PEZI